jgi:hypothetical protein
VQGQIFQVIGTWDTQGQIVLALKLSSTLSFVTSLRQDFMDEPAKFLCGTDWFPRLGIKKLHSCLWAYWKGSEKPQSKGWSLCDSYGRRIKNLTLFSAENDTSQAEIGKVLQM